MSAHAGRFTVPAKVSFEQIFLRWRRNARRCRARMAVRALGFGARCRPGGLG